jgi:hypothetical protein
VEVRRFPAHKPTSALVLLALFLCPLSQLALWVIGVPGALVSILPPCFLLLVTTHGELLELVLKLVTETPLDQPPVQAVSVKPRLSLVSLIVLLRIANKVLGKQFLPAPIAGTEPLILSIPQLKFNRVLSMLNHCSEVLLATALGQ